MIDQQMDVGKAYLCPTELCDFDNKVIKTEARRIAGGIVDPKEAAVKIFYFVRDQIPYGLDRFDVKASDTLGNRVGTCVQKTNLQVALLRACGIPARYHHVVLSQDILKGILADVVYRAIPGEISFHPWCECYLSGNWIACESLFDQALYSAAVKKGLFGKEQIPTIDWGGGDDLVVVTSWIKEDIGAFHSLDDLFKEVEKVAKSSKLVNRIGYYISNRHTNRLRRA